MNVLKSLNSGPSCDQIDGETESFLSSGRELIRSIFWMIFTQGWISLAFVFRSWGQRLRSAENPAFILWIQKRPAKKTLPVACPMQTREMSSAAGGTWSTRGFAHWTGVFSFSQRLPAHPTPLPNKLRGETAVKEQSEVLFPSYKGPLRLFLGGGLWLWVMSLFPLVLCIF